MKSWNKYFNAPIYESSKSSYSLHFQTAFEKSLMKLFDTNPDVIDYFQPLMEISVKTEFERNKWVRIDFWLECSNRTILVHVRKAKTNDAREESKAFDQARRYCQTNDFEFLVLDGFENFSGKLKFYD